MDGNKVNETCLAKDVKLDTGSVDSMSRPTALLQAKSFFVCKMLRHLCRLPEHKEIQAV
jgi:hypothetical protein